MIILGQGLDRELDKDLGSPLAFQSHREVESVREYQ